ncbi:hypothetical protein DK419_15525 [Methylobacterium terrae]|uniref:Peptidase S74 domain-containing protein n=1 Tax=Methylobacterium terrae TaxID=2202827 RepID=A0A2U8WQR1_9HYPH|nr:tail fiber domain-containing protein [Methylobacterium terrae]AWN47542.1 hypothetical protein DK419_15525 [Methylobacterium terrae]
MLGQILTDAQNLYSGGSGRDVYQGPRTAGLGSTTQSGLDYLSQNATTGQAGVQAGNGLIGDLMTNGGQTAGTQAASNAYSGITGVDTSPTAALAARAADPNGLAQTVGSRLAGGNVVGTEGDYRNLMAANAGPTQTQTSLQDVANGNYLAGNPYLDDIVNRSNASAASRVAQQMAASGRYGSGAMGNAVADAVSANEGNLRYQDYNTQAQRQAQAASAIDSANNARAGLQQGLIGAIGSGQAQNASFAAQGANLGMAGDAQALSAANQLASQQAQNASIASNRAAGLAGIATGDRAAALSGISAIPTLQQAALQPGQTLAQAGAIQDAARQDQINADREYFDDTNNARWKQLGLYQSVIQPIAGLGGFGSGTTVSKTETPQPGVLQTLLGAGLTGASILGRSDSNSLLAKGIPMAMTALSDERAKENVEPVGKLKDGQTVYAYNYAGSPQTLIGLLAQDVAEHEPDAVVRRPDGLLAVDYHKATRRAAQEEPRRRAGGRR